jgi:hypothetical protein
MESLCMLDAGYRLLFLQFHPQSITTDLPLYANCVALIGRTPPSAILIRPCSTNYATRKRKRFSALTKETFGRSLSVVLRLCRGNSSHP